MNKKTLARNPDSSSSKKRNRKGPPRPQGRAPLEPAAKRPGSLASNCIIWIAVAAAAADLDDTGALSALDELLAAGMIRPDEVPERYEFGHALVRQAIYDTLSPSRQARLHRRLAHGLEAARARVPSCADPAEIVAQ